MDLKQKLYDLQQQLQEQHDISKGYVEKSDFGDDYTASEKKCDDLEKAIAAVKALIAREENLGQPSGAELEKGLKGAGSEADPVYADGILKGLKASTVKSCAASVRKAMNEGTGSAGGYTVPEDVTTRIYRLIESEDSFANYVYTENVRTNSGARTYKTRAQHSGFSPVNEGAKIGAVTGPTFGRVEFTCTKKGGILPVTNELLEDTDENLVAVIIEWMAAEARATINSNVVTLATTGDATAVTSLDDILAILTVVLGSAIRNISTIHTNDSGLQWLLSLKDGNGRSLLVPNPTEPTQMRLSVGAITVNVKTWDNSVLPNRGDNEDVIPFLIGSLREGIFRFDRRELTVKRSDQGSVTVSGTTINAFESDLTLFRGTMRDDYKIRDSEAFVYATFTPETPGP